jgi:deazaflavin-dependent oxidoreductase (nitroreductase family)
MLTSRSSSSSPAPDVVATSSRPSQRRVQRAVSANANTAVRQDHGADSATFELVGPSPFVRIVLRPLTKLLNPAVRRLAGRRHFRLAAQIHHTGRRSGRPYVTPAGARLDGAVFLIPLTFGNQSDWSRNVQAAGRCVIRLDGRDYQATEPELLDAQNARPLIRSAFNPVERLAFRLLGIRQFMRLRLAGTPASRSTGAVALHPPEAR